MLIHSLFKGARSFKEIRTINNVVNLDFKSACYALGLLDDDKEWHEALNHVSHWVLGKQLRKLFVIILIFCEVFDPYKLWISKFEDILHCQKAVIRYDNLHLDDFRL